MYLPKEHTLAVALPADVFKTSDPKQICSKYPPDKNLKLWIWLFLKADSASQEDAQSITKIGQGQIRLKERAHGLNNLLLNIHNNLCIKA